MNHVAQDNSPKKIRITEVQFEAWPATGLTPSRFCFLHTYFTQHLEEARKTTHSVGSIEKLMLRVH